MGLFLLASGLINDDGYSLQGKANGWLGKFSLICFSDPNDLKIKMKAQMSSCSITNYISLNIITCNSLSRRDKLLI